MTAIVLNLFECKQRSERSAGATPIAGCAPEQTIEQIAETLRIGESAATGATGAYPPDPVFDRFLPEDLRVVSGEYWTPLEVVGRAAGWFEELQIGTVVDIGSGAGKFCVAAALAGHCRFVGVEHRPRLVATARALAQLFKVDDRVHFVEGALGQVPVPPAEACYLYNPFEENLFPVDERMDRSVDLGAARHTRDIAIVEQLLQRARAVATSRGRRS